MKYDPISLKLTAERVVLPRPVQDQSSLNSAQMKWMISRPHPLLKRDFKGWVSGSHCVPQAGFKLSLLLPQPLEYRDK